jgi:signal transduction histidine kinase/CheY-like chemotaxis protein
MRGAAGDLAAPYAAALREHLEGATEHALHQAYELGRAALASGLGVVELVLMHHGALSELLRARPDGDHAGLMGPAADFLSECLSPFEMMLRGYREANAQLSASNAELLQANMAAAAAQEALKAEIAERERAEAALVHAQKLQAVGLLAGGVAHHFNNLLTVVLGNLRLARRRLKDGEDIERFLVSAVSGAERGAEVVKQLLTFSRQQVLETRVLDLEPWMAAVHPLLASALRGDISLEVEVVRPIWPVRTDPAQLELALLNLAVNARDAMPSGGTLRVSATGQQVVDARLGLKGDYVVISVADTGEGVAPDLVSRVFEPFFTTKALGPGAGLGLSQVHGFVNQLGGAIDLESVLGRGTTVRLYLPAAFEAVTGVDDDASATPRQAANGSGRVLVVDDDVEVADLTGQLLAGCGYAVKLVHRAKAALDLLQTGEPIDLLFSDIMMPGGMNGVQLAEEVRRRYPQLPILLATGYSEAMPEATAKGLPIIVKPYDFNLLCDRVGELLRGEAR